jgi:hypothetical protein
MAIEMIDQGKTKKTYHDLCLDMRKSVWREYIHLSPDKQRVLPARTYGNFFPALFADPLKYIIPQPELR